MSTTKHEFRERVGRTSYMAWCTCGKKYGRSTECNGAGIRYSAVYAEEKHAAHLRRVRAPAPEPTRGGNAEGSGRHE